jgi:hypothetical protein
MLRRFNAQAEPIFPHRRRAGAYGWRMTAGEEYDDTSVEHGPDADPDWFPGRHLPPDARRMGLTHHVPDGALLDFAGTLDSSKPYHRIAAWALLVVFGLPVLFAVLRVLQLF